MDYETLGGGASGGILGALLAFFGFNRRINKLEDGKQDKDVCDPIHKSIDEQFKALIKGQDELKTEFRSLNEYIRNRRREYDNQLGR